MRWEAWRPAAIAGLSLASPLFASLRLAVWRDSSSGPQSGARPRLRGGLLRVRPGRAGRAAGRPRRSGLGLRAKRRDGARVCSALVAAAGRRALGVADGGSASRGCTEGHLPAVRGWAAGIPRLGTVMFLVCLFVFGCSLLWVLFFSVRGEEYKPTLPRTSLDARLAGGMLLFYLFLVLLLFLCKLFFDISICMYQFLKYIILKGGENT